MLTNNNPRLSLINTYYSAVDAEVATQKAIIDTYEGMLSLCNNGNNADHLFAALARAEAELAQLAADRAELDRMWNEVC